MNRFSKRWRETTFAVLLSVSLLLPGIAAAQTTVEYIHTDALGSPVAVTDATGMVIERNNYEPYGAVISKPNYQGVGYTGHVQDGATGLTYMQQRYYDPQVGVFLSVDPVSANSDAVGQFHRYRYSNENPYRFSDPDGRRAGDLFGDDEVDLGPRYVGRRDKVPGTQIYEYHVYKRGQSLSDAVSDRDSKGLRKQEVGVMGPDGNWIAKHGHEGAPTLNVTADNRLRGVVAEDARKAGWLPAAGRANIKGDNLTREIQNGMRRTGSLQHLKSLGRSLGRATVVMGWLENLSTERACQLSHDPDICP